jgi:hypothetical protein
LTKHRACRRVAAATREDTSEDNGDNATGTIAHAPEHEDDVEDTGGSAAIEFTDLSAVFKTARWTGLRKTGRDSELEARNPASQRLEESIGKCLERQGRTGGRWRGV